MTVAFNKILGRPCIVASLACVSASSWEQGAVFTVCTVKVQTACNIIIECAYDICPFEWNDCFNNFSDKPKLFCFDFLVSHQLFPIFGD